MRRINLLLLLPLFALLLGSCEDEFEKLANEQLEPPAVASTSDNPNVQASDVKIYDNVRVLTEAPLQDLYPEHLTFTRTADLENVQVGDVLVSGITDVAPYGFLREVTDIERTGERITFLTEEATLNQVFESINLKYEQNLADEAQELSVP